MTETTNDFPRYEDGTPLEVGGKIKLEDGSLVRVEALAVTAGGYFVSDSPVEEDKRWRKVGAVVSSPGADSVEEIMADSTLTIAEYCKKRALDVRDLSPEERRLAVVDDLLTRQEACLTAQGA